MKILPGKKNDETFWKFSFHICMTVELSVDEKQMRAETL